MIVGHSPSSPARYGPLFAELERRGVPFDAVHADEHWFDPAERETDHAVVFNRMSPSAYMRGRGALTFYTSQYLAHLQRLGVRVINGFAAWQTEISKAAQVLPLLGRVAGEAAPTQNQPARK